MSNQREVFSNNLKSLIESKGIDQKMLADYMGISEMSISNWVNGVKYPRMGNVQKLADYFGVMKSDLIEDKEKGKSFYTSSRYPCYPSVSAGVPLEIDGITEMESEKIVVPDLLMGKWAGNQDIYFTRTNGDSMNKIIPDDTLIAVKPVELHELNEKDIVVYRNHGEYAVKRFFKDNERLIFKPYSFDDRFTDDVININDADNLTISGKVVMWNVIAD